MNENHRQLIHQYGYQAVIDALNPYVTQARKQKIHQVLSARLTSIELAVESPADIHNALATIRSCEVFGVIKVHIIAPEGSVENQRAITQGAVNWVDVKFHDTFASFKAQQANTLLACAAPRADLPLSQLPITKPLCLMLGNENRGLSSAANNQCDYLYTIPMFGMAESLNLSVSAAISLYDVTSRKRKQLNKMGDLNAEQFLFYQAYYFLNSVDERTAHSLLKRINS